MCVRAGRAFVGKIVTNYESMKRLKGPKGSEVKLGVFRPGEKETLHFTIVRGDALKNSLIKEKNTLPIHSSNQQD